MQKNGLDQFAHRASTGVIHPEYVGNIVVQVSGYELEAADGGYVTGTLVGTGEDVRVRLQSAEEILAQLEASEASRAAAFGEEPRDMKGRLPNLDRRPSIADLAPELPRQRTATEPGGVVLFRDAYRQAEGDYAARWPEIISRLEAVQADVDSAQVFDVNLNGANSAASQVIAGMPARYYEQGEGVARRARVHLLDVAKASLVTSVDDFGAMVELALKNDTIKANALFKQLALRVYKKSGDVLIVPVKPIAELDANGKAIFDRDRQDFRYAPDLGIGEILSNMGAALREELATGSLVEAIPAYSLGVGRASLHSDTPKLAGMRDFRIPHGYVGAQSGGYRQAVVRTAIAADMAFHVTHALPVGASGARHIWSLETPAFDPKPFLAFHDRLTKGADKEFRNVQPADLPSVAAKQEVTPAVEVAVEQVAPKAAAPAMETPKPEVIAEVAAALPKNFDLLLGEHIEAIKPVADAPAEQASAEIVTVASDMAPEIVASRTDIAEDELSAALATVTAGFGEPAPQAPGINISDLGDVLDGDEAMNAHLEQLNI